MKSGDARVALIGFPSVGKSTMLTKLTETASIAAAYEFTTLTCIPGKLKVSAAIAGDGFLLWEFRASMLPCCFRVVQWRRHPDSGSPWYH